MGAVVNLRFKLLLALLESAGVVAVLVLSFVCVMSCVLWYFVGMSAPYLRQFIYKIHGALKMAH